MEPSSRTLEKIHLRDTDVIQLMLSNELITILQSSWKPSPMLEVPVLKNLTPSAIIHYLGTGHLTIEFADNMTPASPVPPPELLSLPLSLLQSSSVPVPCSHNHPPFQSSNRSLSVQPVFRGGPEFADNMTPASTVPPHELLSLPLSLMWSSSVPVPCSHNRHLPFQSSNRSLSVQPVFCG
jgi:hypothetical protein